MHATTDEQAVEAFDEVFKILRSKNSDEKASLPTIRKLEKFVTHENKWVTVHYPR